MTNNFKESLKTDTKQPDFNSFNIDSILNRIGISQLPEEVEAEISQDNKYLNLKLKDSPIEKHLLFQFPLEEIDLSDNTTKVINLLDKDSNISIYFCNLRLI